MSSVEESAVAQTACSNCGVRLAERYCGHCGQDSHFILTVRHLLSEFIEGMFHFDSTFWQTFLPLLFKPGYLTEQYLAGRRKHFAPPFRSYLVLSIVYFLLASFFSSGETRIADLKGRELSPTQCAEIAQNATWLRRLVPDVESSCVRALGDGRHSLGDAIRALLPKVMFFVVPLVALVQYWLFRSRRPLYAENLIFILHFQSFYFLAGGLLLLLAGVGSALASMAGPGYGTGVGWTGDVLLIWAAAYLFMALRRVYKTGIIRVLISLAVLGIAYTLLWAIGVGVAGTYAFSLA